MNKVSKRFINGLILLVPLAITVFVVTEVLNFTEIVLGKHFPVYYPGMGIVTVLLVIYLVGWLSSYWFMKRVISYGEWLLGKIPVVKFIYNSVKHLSTAVFESNNMFDHVVLVPFHQSRALGFVMAEVPAVLREKLGDDYVCVFVPWSLNMTSGTNLFVKKSDVIYLDISNESALQYMLTAGAVMPQRQMAAKPQEVGSATRLADEVVAASKTQSARAAGEACEEAEPHGTPQR
ncbi:DUF502 domain-containing protein [Selenomonas sputigena]|uniref:DUF502 domain-containing protein n=1 Tax=Selenomonas sputigena TaxID=69823 RepID=UPI0022348C23|nr:DUF502 domain-containing protein [Selenomonas sputigena]UZE45833.1 DUF502 domain-containing protein [Selenomonas sputigena]